MYHYFYKITNGINGKYYYGIHSTEDLNDGYMGSGKLIMKSIKKYGREHFTKDILHFFETREELDNYEREFVNSKLVEEPNCYNLITGGGYPGLVEYSKTHLMVCEISDPTYKIFSVLRDDPRLKTGEIVPAQKLIYKDKITVRDKDGKCFMVDKTDPRYISGELKFVMDKCNLGKVTVRDKYGECFMVDKTDPRYISGELVANTKGKCVGMVMCKDKDGKIFKVYKDDPRYISGELVGVTKGFMPARDKLGNTILVKPDDPRLKTGELVHNTKGMKMMKDENGNIIQMNHDDPRLKTGKFVGMTKGMMVVKDIQGNTFQVSKDDPRLKTGELKSNRVGFKWINKNGKLKSVDPTKLQSYLNDGWSLGVGDARKKPSRKKNFEYTIEHK